MSILNLNDIDISSDMPTFREFYKAINQREPFPWQSRLASHIASTGNWYKEIGVPTGLGKTACLDIAVWWLATQAGCTPIMRIAPTRIWWVVNRRLLVDSTYEHALKIKRVLNNPEASEHKLSDKDQEIVSVVGERLRSIAGDSEAEPLQVIRLRGGIASTRPNIPSQPAIILSTLPMYGSRLLFRGYGSSQGMRSIDAAMAGTDSLVLLDEAHLTPHLRALCSAITQCMPDIDVIPNKARSGPTLVQLTATGELCSEDRFTLGDEDIKHSEIRKRLDAVKLLDLQVKAKRSENYLADAAIDKLESVSTPSTCIVFVNTPKAARKVFSRLKKRMKHDEVLLLTGRMREREAEKIRQRILHPANGMMGSSDSHEGREHHLIVVATQTLEVGADIDAEHLVTEQCGVRALTQRLGRLNRFGRFKSATALYVHMPPGVGKKATEDFWPVYGTEPKDLFKRLLDLVDASEEVSLSPGCIEGLLGFPDSNPDRAPELLPGILWEWIKTSSPPRGEAPVEPYFSGIRGSQKLVSIIWRAHIPQENTRLWPRATDQESIDVPITDVREVLRDDMEEGCVIRLGSDGITVERASRLRPGDQIVLPTDRGLMDQFGWNPESTDTVRDMSLVDYGLPLDAEAIERICGIPAAQTQELLEIVLNQFADDDTEISIDEQIGAVKEILSIIGQTSPPNWDRGEWILFVESLNCQVIKPSGEVPRLSVIEPKSDIPIDDLDERSLASIATELALHNEAVGIFAKHICACIGVRTDLADVIERAGRLHDIGKADQRFQQWLNPSWKQGDVLMAKSDTPQHRWQERRNTAGWPKGGRHEALSARLVRAWLNKSPGWGDSITRDLLIHLVISHHGKARPLVGPVTDDASLMVNSFISGKSVDASADLGIVDWEQPTRFWNLNNHFGPWGLALLETILRLSDQAISARTQLSLNQ
ncbi:MAG: type I-U CRISPR-associated helicase/endonuclease Cas3 [Bacteroidota bacterium]|nr:type I-U CRISPR-associated helicase/endonuclease Cas3 [Bacteroidota bacterium]MXW33331.1 type I-U CRISPR-associated helicase/endonuclease Cas3 [Rhodothermaceae bacterium]MDE2646030.1 type I-U CRISPR-associated helicase/endonuclease Cas3 [Bacteroidota bacterium]MXZ18166.1 type I-U CRISPR-associated helicase/endonuclease Cas3 [Rhodothermaceae bacterium]MYE62726.1 type I-U CRISPR-associated helicase/endonuclease Cas3 [Rhodothermaceae bacterium]